MRHREGGREGEADGGARWKGGGGQRAERRKGGKYIGDGGNESAEYC